MHECVELKLTTGRNVQVVPNIGTFVDIINLYFATELYIDCGPLCQCCRSILHVTYYLVEEFNVI